MSTQPASFDAIDGVVRLDDPHDPRLDDFRDLNNSDHRPDLPDGKGLVIAEGALVVGRLIDSRYPVRAIVGFGSKLRGFIDAYAEEHGIVAEDPASTRVACVQHLHSLGIEIYEVSRALLAAVAGFDMHRGLVAVAQRTEPLSVTQAIDGARTVVVLEGVGDLENIGSIFRNAAGMGVDAVLFGAGCADPLYRRSVRVSMGHVLRLPFAFFEGSTRNWHHSMQQLHEAGFTTVSLTPDPQAPTIAAALQGVEKAALLVGAEGPGLSERTMHYTHTRARIPMAEGTDSLNLATAAAIAFYERDRHLHG